MVGWFAATPSLGQKLLAGKNDKWRHTTLLYMGNLVSASQLFQANPGWWIILQFTQNLIQDLVNPPETNHCRLKMIGFPKSSFERDVLGIM